MGLVGSAGSRRGRRICRGEGVPHVGKGVRFWKYIGLERNLEILGGRSQNVLELIGYRLGGGKCALT